jgi:hypothetical protein
MRHIYHCPNRGISIKRLTFHPNTTTPTFVICPSDWLGLARCMYCYILSYSITPSADTTKPLQVLFDVSYCDSCSTQLTSYIIPRPWVLDLRRQALELEAKLSSSGVLVSHSKSSVNTTLADMVPSRYHGVYLTAFLTTLRYMPRQPAHFSTR